jgi:hypothetical protein
MGRSFFDQLVQVVAVLLQLFFCLSLFIEKQLGKHTKEKE